MHGAKKDRMKSEGLERRRCCCRRCCRCLHCCPLRRRRHLVREAEQAVGGSGGREGKEGWDYLKEHGRRKRRSWVRGRYPNANVVAGKKAVAWMTRLCG